MNKIQLTGFADEIAPELAEQIRVLKKLNISFVEMRGVDGKNLIQHSIEEVKKIKSELSAAGIRLSALGSPLGKINIKDDFAPHFEAFKYAVEVAKVMETPYIRMFSFFISEGEAPEQYTDEVMRRLECMVEYAKAHDVVLLHENEKEIYGDMANRCKEIMERFYGDNFKAVFDFANFVQCGQDTWEAYQMLKPYIAYIHIKDALEKDGSVVPAGRGDGQVERILADLAENGYEGFLSLEPHLADFTGFSALEQAGALEGGKLTGEQAFTLAHDALQEILSRV